MKPFLFYAAICLCLLLLSSPYWHKSSHSFSVKTTTASAAKPPAFLARLYDKATTAKSFAKQKNFNTNICFLIDMDLPSGKDRFFIYDMKKDSVLRAGLVTHGRCNELWNDGRRYSNTVGSACSSPGKYKVGNPYHGTFGLAYKLYGLDSSNSNAFKRYVVLHSHECVPEGEVDPLPICRSDGCPTVSENFLKTLAGLIDKSSKPILLWIY
jgi:hypothetical protein